MFILLGIFIGFILPIQICFNTQLGHVLRSPMLSTFVTFVVGTIPLAIATLILNGSLFIPAETITNSPWWIWIGGILGVIYLMNSVLLFQKLGAFQASLLPILGQIITGLIIDHFGLFNATVVPISISKFIGATCVLIGIIGTTPKVAQESTHTPNTWLYQILGVATGAISAIQTTINGQLGLHINSSLKASFYSFIVGLIACGVVLLITRPFPTKEHIISHPHPWWIWIGGAIGAAFVLGITYLAPIIGVGLAVLTSLLGIVAGGLCIEHFGWFHTPRRAASIKQLISLAIMLAGVLIIQYF